MKNKIICLVLSLVLVGALVGANGAYAWFVSSSGGASGSAGAEHIFTTGNIGYTLYGSLAYPEGATQIVPEEELLGALSTDDAAKVSSYTGCKMFIENTSPIDSQLRIKIVYGYGDTAENIYDGSAQSPLTVELTDSALWSYNGGYFYYGSFDEATSSSAVIPAFNAAAEGATPEVIALFDSIRYSGENTESSAISGKDLTVKVIFEARQSEYVNWTDVGTIYTTVTE